MYGAYITYVISLQITHESYWQYKYILWHWTINSTTDSSSRWWSIYPHLHSAVTPGPDRRGPQAQCTGEMLCVTAPHMLAYWCVSQVMSPPPVIFRGTCFCLYWRGGIDLDVSKTTGSVVGVPYCYLLVSCDYIKWWYICHPILDSMWSYQQKIFIRYK